MKSISFSQIGKRTNQEDAFGWNNTTFVVCDGVGGHTKGEIASNYIKDFVLETAIETTKLNIEKLLIDAQITLNSKYGQNPETIGMGTTFCGLFFTQNNAFIAHIGDSRVYWIKPNQNLVWHTWDHSIVGELVKLGEITREEGRHHPMNNRISKAILANNKNKAEKPEIYKINQIQSGDLFLLCTDGVNEAWSDEELFELMCDVSFNSSEKINLIKEKCNLISKDNNTAILIEIENEDTFQLGNNEEINWMYYNKSTNSISKYEQISQMESTNSLLFFCKIGVLLLCIFVLYKILFW